MNKLEELFDRYPEEDFMIADGFDDAIIGIDTQSLRVIYSVTMCLKVLIEQDGMTLEEAKEYFDFNVSGAFVGESTPIWCEDDLFISDGVELV
jgi:hypothetical protein